MSAFASPSKSKCTGPAGVGDAIGAAIGSDDAFDLAATNELMAFVALFNVRSAGDGSLGMSIPAGAGGDVKNSETPATADVVIPIMPVACELGAANP